MRERKGRKLVEILTKSNMKGGGGEGGGTLCRKNTKKKLGSVRFLNFREKGFENVYLLCSLIRFLYYAGFVIYFHIRMCNKN